MIVLGAPFLYSLNKKGAYLGIEGAAIGLVTGVIGSMLINDAADQFLSGPLLLTYELLTYSCGICMLICGALTSLPLVNARARMALNGNKKVRIKSDSESEE